MSENEHIVVEYSDPYWTFAKALLAIFVIAPAALVWFVVVNGLIRGVERVFGVVRP